jgi:hypothetical protein
VAEKKAAPKKAGDSASASPESTARTRKTTSPRRSEARQQPKAPKKASAARRSRRKKDTCFVICPFGGWHDAYHQEIFCAAIRAAGLEPSRADDLFRSSNIVHDTWRLISSSRVMLADLTGKNANVFYELGLAHAARKPVLLVTQTMDDVPFDLRALRVITYDVQHPSWGELLRMEIKVGLDETLKSPEGSVLPTFLLEEDPKSQPKVTPEERRYLALQAQIDAMRAEMRAETARAQLAPSDSPPIRPVEATELIRLYLGQGLPAQLVRDRIVRRGAPNAWVRDTIRKEAADMGIPWESIVD